MKATEHRTFWNTINYLAGYSDVYKKILQYGLWSTIRIITTVNNLSQVIKGQWDAKVSSDLRRYSPTLTYITTVGRSKSNEETKSMLTEPQTTMVSKKEGIKIAAICIYEILFRFIMKTIIQP